jgi:20S proteasome alpha/beta subunit
MTIAFGLMNGGSVVLAADSREIIGSYAKKTTQKIKHTVYFGKWRLGIVGASDSSHYVDLFEAELSRQLASIKEFDYAKIHSIIASALHRIHKQHIWPRPKGDKPQFNTLIAIQGIEPVRSRSLLVTEESALLNVSEFKSIGIGSYMADYLHRRVLRSSGRTYNASTEFLENLAVFILKQVKTSVEGCDDESLIATFNGVDGSFHWLTNDDILEREEWLNNYARAEAQLFRALLAPSLAEDEFSEHLQRFDFEATHSRKTELTNITKRAEMLKRWRSRKQKPSPTPSTSQTSKGKP